MQIYEGKSLEVYKKEQLQINSEWEQRDFTKGVKSYLGTSVEKILAIGGLRGTGKTVGILQAAENFDIAYILAQENDGRTGLDYIEYLKNTDKKYIVLDEYGWIAERDQLDRYLLTAVQNGKRIIITGTESIVLDYLNYGALIHRVHVLHTTMFTYEEYLRLFHKEHSKDTCREFLIKGGVFENYAIKNFESAKRYIEEAIVKNLAGYLKDEMSEEKARTLTYSVLYKAICPSNLSTVPTLRNSNVTLDNFLSQMGVNTTLIPDNRDLIRVADIFEQIGVIVRIPNFNQKSELTEQYYITNPSLTCQLIMSAYDLKSLQDFTLGYIFESCVAIQLATDKLVEHDIYFFNNGNVQNNPDNKELDLVITDKEKNFAYFFECKFSQNDRIHQDITFLSGYLEENEFADIEILGRYLVYNGKPCVKEYPVGTVVFTPIGRMLDFYFEFSVNVNEILEGERSTDIISFIDTENGIDDKDAIQEERILKEIKKSGFKMTKSVKEQYACINRLQNRFVPLREIADMYKKRISVPDMIKEHVEALGDELKAQQLMRQKEAQTFLPE